MRLRMELIWRIIVALIDDGFPQEDKQFILKNLWNVAYADGRIDDSEETFILKVAAAIGLTTQDVETAKIQAQKEI
jgi:uncharacterized tellurite resistance protein B-like protein